MCGESVRFALQIDSLICQRVMRREKENERDREKEEEKNDNVWLRILEY